jgi:hypothetical protein
MTTLISLLNSLLILPLEAGWMETIYGGVRISMINAASISVIVGTELAAIFCVVKLVGIASDIMGDSKGSGFGTVDVREMLRPLVLFFCIQAFSFILGALDTTCGGITNALSADAAKVKYDATSHYKAVGDELLLADKLKNGKSIRSAVDMKQNFSRGGKGDISEALSQQYGAMASKQEQEEETKTKHNDFFGWIFDKIMDFVVGAQPFAIGSTVVVPLLALISWIMDFLFTCETWLMYALSNIYLSFLAFVGPIVLAFSILDNWQKAWMTWVATYIEISLWKFGIALILKCTELAKSVAGYYITPDATIDSFGKLGATLLGSTSLMMFVVMIISWAGLRCLRNVPAMVHMAMNLGGNSSGLDSGGGAVVGVAKNAASKAVEVGKEVAGGL